MIPFTVFGDSPLSDKDTANFTRCKECGVNHELVMLWDGHSSDKDVKTSVVDRGYTDYSQEYILAEAEKVNYDL